MRLALIGVGLIGGSFARAIKAAGKADHIVGFDSNAEALGRALELGVIDEQVTSPAHAVDGANLVMIATPVGATPASFRAIAPYLSNTAVVTDVGSAKSSVIAAARSELGDAFPRFVPGHPIAGREYSGVEHSEAVLFRDKVFISTPTAQTDADAVRRVEVLWSEIGCHVRRMTPEEHDQVFASVSHLPHLLAFALVAQIAAAPDAKRKFAMSGAGFRDFTRIAASNPAMWTDICVANRNAIAVELSAYRELLTQLQRAVESEDAEMMQKVFGRAALTRRTHATQLDCE